MTEYAESVQQSIMAYARAADREPVRGTKVNRFGEIVTEN